MKQMVMWRCVCLRIFQPKPHYTDMEHISDHDLERYHLGMVTDEDELAALEEHYLGCSECATHADESAAHVDGIRAVIVKGNFDLASDFSKTRSSRLRA